MAPTQVAALLEPLFQAAVLDLIVPSASALPALPARSEGGLVLSQWWDEVGTLEPRDTAFFDETLSYYVSLSVPNGAFSAASTSSARPPQEFTLLVARLQLTLSASFLPTLSERRDSLPATAIASSNLAPPELHGVPSSRPGSSSGLKPPLTPNPFPGTSEADERYAPLEGVQVWEGPVEVPSADDREPIIFRSARGWTAVWRGQLPVAFVRTTIQNPVLALTSSATLRNVGTRRLRPGSGPDNISIISSTETAQSEENDDAVAETINVAEMEEIDLLGGLGGGEKFPASRLGPSFREDLAPQSDSETSKKHLPFSTSPDASSGRTWMQPGAVLRKSFRRVLGLSPGLRVRMRTLFLPQLLPPLADASPDDSLEDAGERRVVLCVEVENPLVASNFNDFEVERITVDIGGKGAKAEAQLVCQPNSDSQSPTFPVRLHPVEQYNLLYTVDIASSSDLSGSDVALDFVDGAMSKGDEQRPVSIILTGRPYHINEAGVSYPTALFQSRWNCTLDLAPLYASRPPPPPVTKPRPLLQHRHSKFAQPARQNAFVGDKRYSLSSLLSQTTSAGHPQDSHPHAIAAPQRPLMQSRQTLQGGRVTSIRGQLQQAQPLQVGEGHGLLVSVKVLGKTWSHEAGSQTPDGVARGSSGIEPFDTFSIEVFVHNRTNDVRRFRLSVPPRDSLEPKVRELWNQRRRRRPDEATWGVDDAVLSAILLHHESSAPALVPLEDDIRCGPLLPGASLAARIRFLALRGGVHRIERLRLTGAADEFDFVISPVIDIVVGDGRE